MLDKVEFRPKSIKCDKGGMLLGLRGFNRNAYATNNTATTFLERRLQERGGKTGRATALRELNTVPSVRQTAAAAAAREPGTLQTNRSVVSKIREPLWLCMNVHHSKREYTFFSNIQGRITKTHTHNTFHNVEPTPLNFIEYKALYKVEIKNTFKIFFFAWKFKIPLRQHSGERQNTN